MEKHISLKIFFFIFIIVPYSCNKNTVCVYNRKSSVSYSYLKIDNLGGFISVTKHRYIKSDSIFGTITIKDDTLFFNDSAETSYIEELNYNINYSRIEIINLDSLNYQLPPLFVVLNKRDSFPYYKYGEKSYSRINYQKPINSIIIGGMFNNEEFYTKDSLKNYIIYSKSNYRNYYFPKKAILKRNKVFFFEGDSLVASPNLIKSTWYRKIYNKILKPEIQLGY